MKKRYELLLTTALQVFCFAALTLLAAPTAVHAQSSARDADIDAKLNAGMLAGIAPPTGAQTSAAGTAQNSKTFIDPYLPAALQAGALIVGQTDGKARVYNVSGNASLTKKGNPVERALKKGDIIEAGDRIVTEAGAKVSITFDESYKNAICLPQNSKVIFESIEPTNIKIEDGSVFSAVDGLPQGSTWKVTTPSAVAAVRGTLYLVNFQAASGQFYAATVNVPDDGKTSAIDIQSVTGAGSANVPEGKQITLRQGEKPDDSLVKDFDPAQLAEIMAFFENLLSLRDTGGNVPPTSGQYDGPGNLDAAGPGVIGGGDARPNLDPQDTGHGSGPPEPPSVPEPTAYGGNDNNDPCQFKNCDG